MDIRRLSCPSCHFNEFEHDEAGNLRCKACGTLIESPREALMCRSCGTENPPQAKLCMNCGSALGRVCPSCNYYNPPGTAHCHECGSALDTLAAISARHQSGSESLRARQHDRLVATKATDAAFMREQRERLAAEESERRRLLAEQKANAQREQRVMIWIFVGLAVLSVACLAAILLLFAM